MSLFDGGQILGAGLSAQRQRFETITTNLANSQTTRTPEGGPYRRRSTIFEAVPLESSFESVYGEERNRPLTTIRVAGIIQDTEPPQKKYDPSHPDADKDGYVSLPNIDPTAEMTDLLATTRSFQAMVAGLGAMKEMINRSIDLGRS